MWEEDRLCGVGIEYPVDVGQYMGTCGVLRVNQTTLDNNRQYQTISDNTCRDDHIAFFMSFVNISVGFGHLFQRIAPVDDSFIFPRFEKSG